MLEKKHKTKSLALLFVILLSACTAADGSLSTTDPGPSPSTHTPLPSPEAEEITSEPAVNANADVEYVMAEQQQDGTWTFTVTVRHPDTGWEDYADGWDVVLPDGIVLKRSANDPFTRLLTHPHEDEQPFTRRQSGLEIPEGVDTVIVRAHDIVDGYGGAIVTVDLTQPEGESFEVIRISD